MKNKKWLTYTLGILLTLIILAAVGAIGFRIGAMQNNPFVHPMMNGSTPAFGHGFDGGQMPNFHQQGSEGRDFHDRGFDRGSRGGFISPIFGLIKLAVLSRIALVLVSNLSKAAAGDSLVMPFQALHL